MLVLTRRLDEAVAVGNANGFEHLLKITVLGIGRGSVRLGFEIDGSVPVHRWEVWQQIHNDAAAETPAEAAEAAIAM